MTARRPSQHGDSDRRLSDDLVYGIEHDLFLDRKGQSWERIARHGVADAQIAGFIHRKVARDQYRRALGEGNPFRGPHLDAGEIALGADSGGSMVGVLASWLTAGLVIVANTGAGKSNLILFLLLQLARFVDGLWATDMYKPKLRHLRPLLARLGKDLIVLKPRQMIINPLQADDRDPSAHLSFIIDLLVRVVGLPSRARTILRQVCHRLYRRFGIFDGKRDRWPTLFDVFEEIKHDRSLNAASREAILDRLGAFLLTLTPQCAAFRRAWSPIDLARHHIVFEMRETSEQVKTFLLSYLLFSVFHHDMEHQSPSRELRHFISFEDAQRFFAGSSSSESGAGSAIGSSIGPMEELAGIVRESGRGLNPSFQSTVGISPGLMANMATKVMGRLGSHQDYQRLGRDMGMTADQIEWAKLHLRPGRFVVQLSEGPWRRPFLIEVPLLKIPPTVGEDEVAQSISALDVLPTVPADEYAHWSPYDETAVRPSKVDRDAVSPAEEVAGGSDDAHTEVGEAELRFLRAVVDRPGRPSSRYPKLARMSPSRAASIRKKLIDAGYIRAHSAATGRSGRNAIVLEPLETACRIVEATAGGGP